MRVVITTTQVPFVYGGAEILANNLKQAVISHGHECEIVSIPFKWYPPERIIDNIMACKLLDLSETNGKPIDKVIALKFPTYLIPHDNKVMWLVHQHRTAYELWNTEYCDLINFPNGREVRDIIHTIDSKEISSYKPIYTISSNVSKRLKTYNNIDSTALYPPLDNSDEYYCQESEDFIFFPSRLTNSKRQEMVIKAMGKVKSDVKIVFAGAADNSDYKNYLIKLSKELGVSDKVIFLGHISEKEKIDYYSRSIAVIYPPLDEDYGYVTLEAMYSGKPLITCVDSGGPLEFADKENSFIVQPNEDAIAQAIEQAHHDKKLTSDMGRRAKEKIVSMDINWDKVLEGLLY